MKSGERREHPSGTTIYYWNAENASFTIDNITFVVTLFLPSHPAGIELQTFTSFERAEAYVALKR